MEHRAGQTAGLGVLLAGVIGAEEGQAVRELMLQAVAKTRVRGWGLQAQSLTGVYRGIEGNLTQWQQHLHVGE